MINYEINAGKKSRYKLFQIVNMHSRIKQISRTFHFVGLPWGYYYYHYYFWGLGYVGEVAGFENKS